MDHCSLVSKRSRWHEYGGHKGHLQITKKTCRSAGNVSVVGPSCVAICSKFDLHLTAKLYEEDRNCGKCDLCRLLPALSLGHHRVWLYIETILDPPPAGILSNIDAQRTVRIRKGADMLPWSNCPNLWFLQVTGLPLGISYVCCPWCVTGLCPHHWSLDSSFEPWQPLSLSVATQHILKQVAYSRG